jgi:hypothetical protein
MCERKTLVPVSVDDTTSVKIKRHGWFGFLNKEGKEMPYGKTPSGANLTMGFLNILYNDGNLSGAEDMDIQALKKIHKYDGIRICLKKTYQQKDTEFKDNHFCNVFNTGLIHENDVVIDYMWNDIVEQGLYTEVDKKHKGRIPVEFRLTKYTNWEKGNNIEYIVNINYKDTCKFNENGTSYEVLKNYINDEKKYEIY